MGNPIDYENYIKNNIKKSCKVSYCDIPRRGVSAYCKRHASQRNLYGHAPSRYIHKREFEVELSQVSDVIKRNMTHKGIQQALSFFTYWMEQAYRDYKKVPAGPSMRIARELDTSPLDFLRYTSAMTLLYEGPKRLIKSDLHLIYQIGSWVLYLCPCKTSRSAIGTVRRRTGEFAWKGVGIMLNGITKQAIQDERSLRKEEESYLAPLD